MFKAFPAFSGLITPTFVAISPHPSLCFLLISCLGIFGHSLTVHLSSSLAPGSRAGVSLQEKELRRAGAAQGPAGSRGGRDGAGLGAAFGPYAERWSWGIGTGRSWDHRGSLIPCAAQGVNERKVATQQHLVAV